MQTANKLEEEYVQLLAAHGLQPPARQLDKSKLAGFLHEMLKSTASEGVDIPSDLETSKQFVETMSQQFGDSFGKGFSDVLNRLSKEVEDNIQKGGFSLNQEIYIGEFPTGSFNAQARSAPDGVLVLINTGLMMLIHQVAKIMSLSFNFVGIDETGQNVAEGFQQGSGVSQEVIDMLAEVVLAYLLYRDSTVAKRLSVPGGGRYFFVTDLVHNCEKFVVAHEYGHAVAGHLNTPRSVMAKTPVGNVEFVQKSWEHEFQADILATQIMLASSPRQIENPSQLLQIQTLLGGPLFFFALDNLITQVVENVLGLQDQPIITDHPPSQLRSKMQWELIQRIGDEQLLQIGYMCEEWFSKVQDDVIKVVRRVLR